MSREASVGTVREQLLHVSLAHGAARWPERVAIVDGSTSLTYRQVDRRANRLAHRLRERIGALESIFGVYMERSADAIVAMVGTLKAGGAFLPLDPDYPAERLAFQVRDAGCQLILTSAKLAEEARQRLGVPVEIIEGAALDAGAPEAPPALPGHLDQLAYVIYTSGSTGRPKGVLGTHRALVNRFAWMLEEYPFGPDEVCIQKTRPSFVDSVWETFGPLVAGCRLVVFPQGSVGETGGSPATELTALVTTLVEQEVSRIVLVPGLLQALLDERIHAPLLTTWTVSGEALSPALAARFHRQLPGRRLLNLYGSTEVAGDVTWHDVPPGPAALTTPIGGPIPCTSIRVLAAGLREVAEGEIGRIFVGGVAVNRGYLGQPGLTAVAFVPDPVGHGGRLYDTGDLGRWLPGGLLDYCGRADHQVKIRGNRVELGEVEAALLEHADVREAAVTTWGGEHRRLVAHVVARQGAGPLPADLRCYLESRLPSFAVPSAYVIARALPRTPSGKIDRAALPAPDPVAVLRPEDELRGATEERVGDHFRELLGLASVGRDVPFLDLGGDSLLAMRLVARLREETGAVLSMRDVLERGSPAAVAALVDERRSTRPASTAATGADRSKRTALRPRPAARYEPFPLTDVQQAYWLGRSTEYELGGLSMHGFVEIELAGLDLARLERVIDRLVARHDMLRAIVLPEGRQRVLQVVPGVRIPLTDLRTHDPAASTQVLVAERERLAHQILPLTEWPLFEITAILLPGGSTRLLVSLDGIMCDAGSIHILVSELVELYTHPENALAPIDVSFRDHVLHQLELEEAPGYQESLAYWKRRIPELAPPPELPIAIPPGLPRFTRRTARLPAESWRALRRRSVGARLTPSACLLAAYGEVLARWSRRSRLLINLTLFNRLPVHPDIERVVGDFTSLVLLEVDGSTRRPFVERARAAQAQLWRDLDHRQVSGVRVLREMATAAPGRALAPVVFTSTLGGGEFAIAGQGAVAAEVSGLTQTPQVLLDNTIGESRDGALVWTWDAVEAAFPPGMLDQMFDAFAELLDRLAADDRAWQVDEPGLHLAHAHPAAATALEAATEIPPARLDDQLLPPVTTRPDQTALVSGMRRLSFKELHCRARQIQNLLGQRGVGPGALVAIVMEKGWEQVVAALGVLRTGAAYVPVEADWPTDRIRRIVTSCGVRVVLTQSQIDRSLHLDPAIVRMAVDQVPPTRGVDASPAAGGVDDLAYVIFTSGSTGEPKGVMIPHRGAWNTIADLNQRFSVGPDDRLLSLSALSFDLSVYDLFGTLAAGARLVLPGPEQVREPAAWLELMKREGVTVWNSVPALMEMLANYLDEPGADASAVDVPLRLVLLSGDWIPVDLPDRVRRLFPHARVVSLGGATEASIWSIVYPIDAVDPAWRSIPYGHSLRGQSVQVLDDAYVGRPVGVPGELYIGGRGLALGYLGDPAETAARFVVSPRTGERLYRTGDWGKVRPDGAIEFLGRDDRQVKIGGYRIELGEIEAALAGHPHVAEAVAIVTGKGNHRRVVAFAVPRRAPECAPAPPPAGPPRVGFRQDLGPGLLDDDVARAAFKLDQPGLRREAGLRRLAFPEDAASAGWAAASLRRRTERRFAQRSVGLGDLGRLLGPLRHIRTDGPLPKLRYPSAGSLYPVQVYLHVKAGQGIGEGVYYHDPARHELVLLREGPVIGPSAYAVADQDTVTEASFAIFLVAHARAIAPLYGRLSRDLSLVEAGHIGQILMEEASLSGLGLCPIGDLDADSLRRELGLESDGSFLYGFLGGPSLSISTARLARELMTRAASTLPAYMVPADLRVIETFPLSSNGKVDPSALERLVTESPAPPPSEQQGQELAVSARGSAASTGPSRAEIVARLLEIWRRVLRRPALTGGAHFFEQGGNSLSATQVIAAVHAAWGAKVSLRSMFDRPTLEAFADLVLAATGPRGVSSGTDRPTAIPRRPR